jgi:hypothetical protein
MLDHGEFAPAIGGDVLQIEIEQEEEGRWLAEVPALPDVMENGAKRDEARNKAAALALRVSPTASNMARRFLSLANFSSRPHEPLEIRARHTGLTPEDL